MKITLNPENLKIVLIVITKDVILNVIYVEHFFAKSVFLEIDVNFV